METVKNELYIPEENIFLSFEVTSDKPFNKCFNCNSFRNGCSGPNLGVMGVARCCEFLQMTRIFIRYTYQKVADETTKLGIGLSLATVKRILTGKITNPDFVSITALSIVLLGDPNGKYPCAIPNMLSNVDNDTKLKNALVELERAMNDNKDYRQALDNIHASYNAEMQLIRDDAQKKIEYLLASNERLRVERDKWRAESESWRTENERKGKIIDTYISKLIK